MGKIEVKLFVEPWFWNSSLEMGLDYLNRVTTAESENLSQFAQYLQDHTCKNLSTLHQDLKQTEKKIKSQMNSLQKTIEQGSKKRI